MSDVDINWFGREFLIKATEANVKAMKMATFVVEATAKKSFGRGATQINTKVRRGKNFHRPSAPGSAPAVDFGILKSSVASQVDVGILTVDGFVGSDIKIMEKGLRQKKGKLSNIRSLVQYGFFQEVGTKFMKARPWLRPALKKSGSQILRIFQKANS